MTTNTPTTTLTNGCVVKVGDVVPMTDGSRAVVIDIDLSGDKRPVQLWAYTLGRAIWMTGAGEGFYSTSIAIDLAALAAQAQAAAPGEREADGLRPAISNADEWNVWLEDHRDSESGFLAVQIVEAIEEHQRALARHVYALAEATQDECHGKDDAYHRGRYHEAKGIARTINAIMPLSRDPAARAPSPEAAPGDDREAIEKAAYMRGWNDREDDLILGVRRIMPEPAPGVEAKVQALIDGWRERAAKLDAKNPVGSHTDDLAGVEIGVMQALRSCADSLAALIGGDHG